MLKEAFFTLHKLRFSAILETKLAILIHGLLEALNCGKVNLKSFILLSMNNGEKKVAVFIVAQFFQEW